MSLNPKNLLFFNFLPLCLLLSASLSASPVWENRHRALGDNSDRLEAIAAAGSGNTVATGYTVKEGNYKDFLVVKFNGNGDTLWARSYNGLGNGNDEAYLVAVDILGNIYAAGFSEGTSTEDDILILKYDSNGNLLWAVTWDNSIASLDDYPTDIALDGSGNLYLCGNTEPDIIPGSSDFVTLKYDPSGNVIWQSIYSRPGVFGGKDEASAITVDALGDAYVCGRSSNGFDDDFATLKYASSNGASIWSTAALFNGNFGDDRAVDLVLDPLGAFITVTGRSKNSAGDDDVRTIKYTTAGLFQWTRAYNSPYQENDRPVAITTDANGNLFIAGQTDVNTSGLFNYDYLAIKYNTSGTLLWSAVEGHPAQQNDIPTAIALTASGNVVLSGYADRNPDPLTEYASIMTVAWNDAGVRQFANYLAGTKTNSDNEGDDLILDPSSGNLMVVGYLENNITQKDAVLISYSSTNGTLVWKKELNLKGDFTSSLRAIISDNSLRTTAVGYAYEENDERDALIKVMDNSGQTLCTYTFNGSNDEDDEFKAVKLDASGNVYAAGYTKTIDQKSNYLLVKYNTSLCDTVWTRQYNYSANQSDRAEDLVIDAQGNIYVTGRSDSYINDTLDNNDVVTIKYSPTGSLLWLQRFNGTGNLRDEPAKILLDNNGAVLVCGRTENLQNDDFFVIKYDQATGNPIWVNPGIYNGPFSNDDRALDMAVDANNNIFLSGYSQTGQGTSSDDGAVVKFDPNGNITGFFAYDGTGAGDDQGVAITTTSANEVIAVFLSDADSDPNISNYNILTFKLDNNLNGLLWAQPAEYDGAIGGDDLPIKVATSASNDIFVIGSTEASITATSVNRDMLVLRYDNFSGAQTWMTTYDGPASSDDDPNAILINGTALTLAGYSEGLPTNQRDAVVLRYDLSTAINTVYTKENELLVYPNPASSTACVVTPKSLVSGAVIKIYSSDGKLMLCEPVSDSMTIDVSNWSNGCYETVVVSESNLIRTRFIVQHP
jgi:uncharacterized delta-60 repeat protein